jgi:uncharacterized repeat protein (TIGR02543 family)
MKKLKLLAIIAIGLIVFFNGCKDDDYEAIVGVCPLVVSTIPVDKTVDVPLNQVISATFNEKMDPATINQESFIIQQGTSTIAGTVAYSGLTATFTPSGPLLPNVLYSGTIKTLTKDLLGQSLMEDHKWSFTTIAEVSLSSNPTIGGTTSGAGTFRKDTAINLVATANAGYSFVNWTQNGTPVSTTPVYQFTMNGNKALVANFTLQLVVGITTNPAEGGTTTGAGTYTPGANVTVTATPNSGYTFTNWTEGLSIASTNATYMFQLDAGRNLVANFAATVADTYTLNVTAVNGTVAKVPVKTAYNSGEIVVLTAIPATGYTFTGWTGDATGSQNPLSVTMNENKDITANFSEIQPNTFTLNVTAFNGSVLKNPELNAYNSGDIVLLTATPNSGYTFTGWSGDANGTQNPLSVTMNDHKNITANFTAQNPVGPLVVLGTSGDFSILTKSGISSTGITSVQGDIGVSPAAASAITGFGLIMDTNGQSAHTTIATHVTGKVYASDYAPPTPSKLTVAVSDMETAYTTANNLVTPAPVLEQGAGNISGLTLAPGLYKWSTGVLIDPDGSVTLSGGANDTWVFQIAQDLTLMSGAQVKLIGGAQAKNITWVVAGQAVLGTNTELYGTIMSKTLISLNTGAKVTGRLLAQTAVTLNTSTVVKP